MVKYINKQYGVTLLELLATIAISSIFITIIFSVITTTFNQNDKTLSHVNLRQEANLIITDIRSKHQGVQEYSLCKSDLLPKKSIIFEEFKLFDKKIDCAELINPQENMHVEFILAENGNKFEIDTIIEGTDVIGATPPITLYPGSPLPVYDFLVNENILIYGSTLDIKGSTMVGNSEDDTGTLFINNDNNSDLIFQGNNLIPTKNIYINKKGNKIVFNSSTLLGIEGKTNLVRIEGDVNLENGAAGINAETVFIDGNVTFGSSAKIIADRVIITGNVTFQNWSASINAKEIYIFGSISKNGNSTVNIVGQLKEKYELDEASIPKNIHTVAPTLYEENWYKSNGYEVRTSGRLLNDNKIYSNGNFTATEWHSDRNNVIIISEGDINIQNFGGSTLTGILFAPNGKVTFTGESFEGVVFAKNGFFTHSNPHIYFSNFSKFIKKTDPIPFY